MSASTYVSSVSTPLSLADNYTSAKDVQSKTPFWKKVLFQPGYQSLVFSSVLLLFLYIYVLYNFKSFLYVDPVSTMQFFALFIIAIVSHGTIAITLQQDTGTILSHWFY